MNREKTTKHKKTALCQIMNLQILVSSQFDVKVLEKAKLFHSYFEI